MNQLSTAKKSLTTIAAFAPEKPPMPAELAQKIATFDGMEIVRRQVPLIVVEQAQAYIAVLQLHHAPPPPARVELWCRKLRNGVAPISEHDLALRIEAVQLACGELPGWVWTEESLKVGLRTFKFFPAASEVFELLGPIADKGVRGMYQVRLLAEATPAPDEEATLNPLPRGLVAGVVTSLRGAT